MSLVVVGAAIIRAGRLLAAQRARPASLAGCWEFPGGKVDPGESDKEALLRECSEELGVRVVLGDQVGGDWPLSETSLMRVWTARLAEGEPRALEHMALRWLGPDELYDVGWLPGDLPVVERIEALLAGHTGLGS